MKHPRSPWSWIPTLYIAEGLPYFAVNTLTVLMYTNLGMSKGQMAFLTGWLYLPWVIKPFWSPFIDLFKTKRLWVLAMQIVIGIAMGGVALSLFSSVWIAISLVAFWVMAFASATHDIAADGLYILALDQREQAAYVGVRSTFYRVASVVGQGGLVMLAGWLETRYNDIPKAWTLTFGLLSIFFGLVALYHTYSLPKVASDHPIPGVSTKTIAADFLDTFVTFFKKPYIISALAFMLLYRLPEALCLKLVQPFLKDPHSLGGLGLSTTQIGLVNGTVGVLALLAGGIVGGVVIARGGLRKWIWPMAAALTLPCVVYCYMAAALPDNFILISTLIGIEQFGYGFGFTAFMMFLMYFSKGESSTSHYAFCTAFMALGMMLPCMWAGWLYEKFDNMDSGSVWDIVGCLFPGIDNPGSAGYIGFFLCVMLSTLATFAVTWLVRRNMPDTSITTAVDNVE